MTIVLKWTTTKRLNGCFQRCGPFHRNFRTCDHIRMHFCHIESYAISASCRNTLNLVGTITYHFSPFFHMLGSRCICFKSFAYYEASGRPIIKIKSMWANSLFGNISAKCQNIKPFWKFKLILCWTLAMVILCFIFPSRAPFSTLNWKTNV